MLENLGFGYDPGTALPERFIKHEQEVSIVYCLTVVYVQIMYFTLALLYFEKNYFGILMTILIFFPALIILIIMCNQFEGNLHHNWGISIHSSPYCVLE